MTVRTIHAACRLKKYPRPVECWQGNRWFLLNVRRGIMRGDDLSTIVWSTGWLSVPPFTSWLAVLDDLSSDGHSGTNPGWFILSDTAAFSKPPAPRKAKT